jgi:hypothetical protein
MPLMDQRFKDGVTYGTEAERIRILDALEAEQKRSNLGFVQYKRILELMGVSND